MRSVACLRRQAPEFGEEQRVAYKTKDQQPGAPFHGQQNAPAQDKAHQQVNQQRQNEFHTQTIASNAAFATFQAELLFRRLYPAQGRVTSSTIPSFGTSATLP